MQTAGLPAGGQLRVRVPAGEQVQSLTLLAAGTGRAVATLPTEVLTRPEPADLVRPTLMEGLYVARLATRHQLPALQLPPVARRPRRPGVGSFGVLHLRGAGAANARVVFLRRLAEM